MSIRTFCSFPYFYLYFSSSVKSQYAAQIKPLSLKCGDYQYFDVASLNEERYGEDTVTTRSAEKFEISS